MHGTRRADGEALTSLKGKIHSKPPTVVGISQPLRMQPPFAARCWAAKGCCFVWPLRAQFEVLAAVAVAP